MSTDSEQQARTLSLMQLYVFCSLLNLEESHAYGIYKEIVSLNNRVPITESVNVSSVYKSIDNLTKNELLHHREGEEIAATHRARGKIYSISGKGWEVLVEYLMLQNKIQQLFA